MEDLELRKKYIINKDINIYEMNNETLVVLIKSKNNVFKISRENFYKIDDMLLPYLFILLDNNTEQKYLFKVKEPRNELREAFSYTKKNEIYFGKQILQNKVNKEKIIGEIKKLGEK